MSRKKKSKVQADPQHLWDSTDDFYGDAFDRKYAEWEQRDWQEWLGKELRFPFTVRRQEDMSSNPFSKPKCPSPFDVDRVFTVTAIKWDENSHEECFAVAKTDSRKIGHVTTPQKTPWWRRLLAKADSGELGHVPLSELEVEPKSDPNYWPVREFCVWKAN